MISFPTICWPTKKGTVIHILFVESPKRALTLSEIARRAGVECDSIVCSSSPCWRHTFAPGSGIQGWASSETANGVFSEKCGPIIDDGGTAMLRDGHGVGADGTGGRAVGDTKSQDRHRRADPEV